MERKEAKKMEGKAEKMTEEQREDTMEEHR